MEQIFETSLMTLLDTKLSSDSGEIYIAIPKIMSEMPGVAKDQKNPAQNYNYRGIDDVMNAISPLMAKHSVFASVTTLDVKRYIGQSTKGTLMVTTLLTVKLTLHAKDGSFVSSIIIGEGTDVGDKSANKAHTMAFKYGLIQMFGIRSEDLVDADAESPEHAAETQKKPPVTKPKQGDDSPELPKQEQEALKEEAQKPSETPAPTKYQQAVALAKEIGIPSGELENTAIKHFKVKEMQNLTPANWDAVIVSLLARKTLAITASKKIEIGVPAIYKYIVEQSSWTAITALLKTIAKDDKASIQLLYSAITNNQPLG